MPGVGEEALGVKVVVQVEVKRPTGGGRKTKEEQLEQLGLKMQWTPEGGTHED